MAVSAERSAAWHGGGSAGRCVAEEGFEADTEFGEDGRQLPVAVHRGVVEW